MTSFQKRSIQNVFMIGERRKKVNSEEECFGRIFAKAIAFVHVRAYNQRKPNNKC